MTNFQALNLKLDSMISEQGYHKTANLITLAYELDHITEAQGRVLRAGLAGRYRKYANRCGKHFLGLDAVELPEYASITTPETNAIRCDAAFDNVVYVKRDHTGSYSPLNQLNASMLAGTAC